MENSIFQHKADDQQMLICQNGKRAFHGILFKKKAYVPYVQEAKYFVEQICSGELSNATFIKFRYNEDIDTKSISIMLSIDKNGEFSKKQLISLKDLIGKIIEKYDITKNDVYIEYDINCSRRPIVFADEPIILYDLLNPKIPRIRL